MECINNMNNSLENWCIANNKKYLIEEWDYESNDILPSQVTYGSHKEVFWICQNGHKYKKQIHSRCQGTGCSICSGVNFQRRNLLFDDYPEFLDELDLTVNTYDDLKNITCSSQKKISWICKKNHKYIQSVVNKVKGKGCPICNNKQVLQGFNDLVTWCKYNNCTEILDDWDYELNDFLPEEVTYGSNKMCNFICHICGYKWKTRINSRTSQKTGCFKCSKRMSSSFPEQAIYYYLKKHFPDAINGDRECLAGKELDIYIPSCKFAIEYDGQTWHKDIKKDENKDLLCKEKDINLYRIREDNCKLINTSNSSIYIYKYQNWNQLNVIIIDILKELGIYDTDIDILRDEYSIKEQYYIASLKDSLGNLYPNIAKEWHPIKNGNITPYNVLPDTHDLYYWLCPKCGNTYKAMVKNRVRMKSGCPKCGKENASNKQKVKVKNINTGEIFDSVSDAAKKYNVDMGGIRACCRGITNSSHGYKWEYIGREEASRPVNQKQKKQKKVLNVDTGEIYDSLKVAIDKTHIQNISACCRGVRTKAGGFRWKYIN